MTTLWGAGAARDSNPTLLIGGREGRIWTRWSGAERLEVNYGDSPSWQEYVRSIRDRQYTVLLADYSFLQIGYVVQEQRVVKHRLVYYPCPIYLEPDEANEFGIVDLCEGLTDPELLERLRQETPFRFEYDEDAVADEHPASHLHVSRPCCRIPVYAPLSLGRFVRFVVRHFYPELWRQNAGLRRWPCAVVTPSIRREDRREIHLACE